MSLPLCKLIIILLFCYSINASKIDYKRKRNPDNMKSKYNHVYFHKGMNKSWGAQMYLNKKCYQVGFFENPKDAAIALNKICNDLGIEERNPNVEFQNKDDKFKCVYQHVRGQSAWYGQFKYMKKAYSTRQCQTEEEAAYALNQLCLDFDREPLNPELIGCEMESKQQELEMKHKRIKARGSIRNSWHAKILHNQQHYYLGLYRTEEEAAKAVNAICRKLDIPEKNPEYLFAEDYVKKQNCPENHGLHRFLSNGDFTCDECDKFPEDGARMYGCTICDFDICSFCWKKARSSSKFTGVFYRTKPEYIGHANLQMAKRQAFVKIKKYTEELTAKNTNNKEDLQHKHSETNIRDKETEYEEENIHTVDNTNFTNESFTDIVCDEQHFDTAHHPDLMNDNLQSIMCHGERTGNRLLDLSNTNEASDYDIWSEKSNSFLELDEEEFQPLKKLEEDEWLRKWDIMRNRIRIF